jgi:hypothetical protein
MRYNPHSLSGGSNQTGKSPAYKLAEFPSMVRADCICWRSAFTHLLCLKSEKEITILAISLLKENQKSGKINLLLFIFLRRLVSQSSYFITLLLQDLCKISS